MKIKADNFFLPLRNTSLAVLHLAPLSSLQGEVQISLSQVLQRIKKDDDSFAVMGSGPMKGWHSQFNYNGLIRYFTEAQKKLSNYIQFFRDGSLESVMIDIFDIKDSNAIDGGMIENNLRSHGSEYIKSLQKYGITYPFFIGFSILGIRNKIINEAYRYRNMPSGIYHVRYVDPQKIPEDDLMLPTQFVEDEGQLQKKLQNTIDMMWNASGYDESPLKETP
jgi:hypothetical protein